ncbi:uncharacterized protein LOC116841686 [Odontomachus brunneus]|uniref:uncharacterized protein LOC116841686 n=1 Tax=Odontomachus brunneus TaxID=486640 RepID=UPI0013F2B106|nr:uncharacterized protein LOC116841686 [Odontomachus brunneus]
MIPAPKDVPNYRVAEVFDATTGFVRSNPQRNGAPQSTLDAENPLEIMDSYSTSQQNLPRDQVASASKSSEGFLFRGFAENEISTTIRNHVKNVKHMYGLVECDSPRLEVPLDDSSNPSSRADRQADSSSRRPNDNPQNRSDGSKCQMSICRQYLLNKRCRAPAGCTTSESQPRYSPWTAYQETSSAKMCDNTETILDLSRDKAPRLLNNVRYSYKKCDDTDAFDKKPGGSNVDQKNAQTIEQETIKDSIRKMDDVCWEDEDRSIFVDVLETKCAE